MEYIRKAKVLQVIDGDTLVVDIDLGFRTHLVQRIRVLGIDCPEMKGETREAGIAAKQATMDWVAKTKGEVVLITQIDKTDSFGRVLAEVCSEESYSDSLGTHLLKNNHAVPYRKCMWKEFDNGSV